MEYLATIIFISPLAILKALTAKHDLLTIPWVEVYKKPIYFGGIKEIKRGAIYLVAWIIASVTISLIVAFTLKNSSEIAKYVYDYIGYDNENAGTAGLITIVVFNIALYLHLVSKTKYIVKKRIKDLPPTISNKKINKPENYEMPDNKKEAIRFLLRKIYYLVPYLLSHIYRFFYCESSHLVHGAARLTFDKYGKEIILNFFESHLANSKDSDLAKLSTSLIDAKMEGYDRALALLEMKIELKGYNSTNKYIQNYIKKLRAESQFEIERRSSIRKQPALIKEIKFINSGTSHLGTIPEYCSDFSGLYLATKTSINPNQVITLVVGDQMCEAIIVHKNVLTTYQKTYSGCGVKITSENAKSILSEQLCA